MAKKEENIFEKFYSSYTLDLASAFWVFGVFGSAIAGFIFGYLSDVIHHWLILPYYAIVLHIIIALLECTGRYIKEKKEKPEGDSSESEIQTNKKASFCYIGHQSPHNACVQVSDVKKCMSGKIFKQTYIPVRQAESLIGKIACNDIKKDEPLQFSNFE